MEILKTSFLLILLDIDSEKKSSHIIGFAWEKAQSSEEVGLAHDTHELVLRDFTVTIAISLLDHLLDLIICHILAELFRYAF